MFLPTNHPDSTTKGKLALQPQTVLDLSPYITQSFQKLTHTNTSESLKTTAPLNHKTEQSSSIGHIVSKRELTISPTQTVMSIWVMVWLSYTKENYI